MIEQTVAFPELVRGLARCVREWLVPHLSDPLARAQAAELAAILDDLPVRYGSAAAASVAADNAAARALLTALGEVAAPAAAPVPDVDALMRENAALKGRLEALAASARAAGDAERLALLRRFFAESLGRETPAGGRGPDFAAMTTAEDAARRT